MHAPSATAAVVACMWECLVMSEFELLIVIHRGASPPTVGNAPPSGGAVAAGAARAHGSQVRGVRVARTG